MIGGETDTRHHQTTARIYRYDIAHNTWKLEQATAPLAFSEAASCPLKDGQILVIGGYDSTHDITLDKVWLVDLSTLNWTPLASLPSGGSRLGAAVSDGAGHVYLVRGNGSNPDRPTQDFWRLS